MIWNKMPSVSAIKPASEYRALAHEVRAFFRPLRG
jgi:hypothetical protein